MMVIELNDLQIENVDTELFWVDSNSKFVDFFY